MVEKFRIGMRVLYRAVGLVHVLLGFFLALGFIGSVQSFTELDGMAWDFRLFFYLSLLSSACLFALSQAWVRDADARRLWVRRLLLGVHFTLGLYLLPIILVYPILDPHILIPASFIAAVQLVDRGLWSVLGRIAALLIGALTSFIIIAIIITIFIDGFIGFILPLFFH